MLEKANVVMLTTEKAAESHISKRNRFGNGGLKEGTLEFIKEPSNRSLSNLYWETQHLYFTFNRMPLEHEYFFYKGSINNSTGTGVYDDFVDLCINIDSDGIATGSKCKFNTCLIENKKNIFVITATTDPNLWKMGIPKIGLDFLERFVKESIKGNLITEVMLECEQINTSMVVETRNNGTVIIKPIGCTNTVYPVMQANDIAKMFYDLCRATYGEGFDEWVEAKEYHKLLTVLETKEQMYTKEQMVNFACDAYNKHYNADASFKQVAENLIINY